MLVKVKAREENRKQNGKAVQICSVACVSHIAAAFQLCNREEFATGSPGLGRVFGDDAEK